ncbi:biotin--[acetyl-CoA-carboxylase] ligase [Corynebacterium marquesiae]|uniref:Biotin--[acetyl-CoA-carboxylase] ligase n=1 Tax=Corynebacterium marquesiae TaxID=2913503 RepID=A0ABU8P6G2_9CORY|nr:biotin--[acetyl-CoA-carboxylase] ligase [Corynebacterium marquesiae]MCG7447367.1 biotin--[acetyl-CoA-carboxylase] ligase [Corynebacterium aurimucosum]MDU7599071.1 biotin--[acetyl-CoA-carboxylase] ligase [Corynebacterium sp.]MDK8455403.1 biotin--[acetyl-CoA-carboxylase] ligase [Corynebacterium marquesiae]MDK8480723.1 biotin--[acetyl-CoA-carboxylase] ligase [Corynebacterium marquesiae]MDK8496521.1 biotin--[acetyl-CoA-carboxylase] ligase [Corynebacterium marquesiae]
MTALDLERIRTALADDFTTIDFVEKTGSTNTDLMQATNVADGTVLLADEQLSGKGRLGRTWTAPAGSQVIFSVLLLPESLEHLGTLPLAAGLAVTDSIEGTVLKWPNDVHIDGNKLCGILAEAGPVGQAFKAAPKTELTKVEVGKAEVNKAEVNKAEVNKAEVNKAVGSAAPSARVVVGMGINVTLTREDLPIEKATSLELEGRDTDRTELAITVLKNLRRRIAQWENQDPQLLRDYRAVCSSLGQEVRLETPSGDVTGHVDEIGEDGRIMVAGEYYSAGDVTHLRPQQ